MAIDKDIQDKRSQLVDTMFSLTPPIPGVQAADTRQFFAGFVDGMVEASHGNTAPRDEYLRTVIPAVKEAGISFESTVVGMLQATAGAAACFDGENQKWVVNYCTDYTARLLKAWNS